MKFVEIINQKKFTLISIFLFLYVMLNLLDGERGLISYYEKQKLKDQLIQEKKALTLNLNSIENKNSLLTGVIDIDYLETSIKCIELFQWLARHFNNKNFNFDEYILLVSGQGAIIEKGKKEDHFLRLSKGMCVYKATGSTSNINSLS